MVSPCALKKINCPWGWFVGNLMKSKTGFLDFQILWATICLTFYDQQFFEHTENNHLCNESKELKAPKKN